MTERHRFGFKVLGRYQHENDEMAVTVNMVAGSDGHLVHAGTLTMSESEWETFAGALREALGDDVEIVDRSRSA